MFPAQPKTTATVLPFTQLEQATPQSYIWTDLAFGSDHDGDGEGEEAQEAE